MQTSFNRPLSFFGGKMPKECSLVPDAGHVLFAKPLRFAFVKGVGAAPPDNPRVNFTGDPYWTDGLRLVMWLSNEPVTYQKVENEHWAPAPR
jgi:hypothetical protein